MPSSMPRAKECATFRSVRKHFSRAWGRRAPPPSLSDLSPSFSAAFAIGWFGERIAWYVVGGTADFCWPLSLGQNRAKAGDGQAISDTLERLIVPLQWQAVPRKFVTH